MWPCIEAYCNIVVTMWQRSVLCTIALFENLLFLFENRGKYTEHGKISNIYAEKKKIKIVFSRYN